jgi:HD-GYP domain-containing protein (c-di-GMP phosphodiesterase class II)
MEARSFELKPDRAFSPEAVTSALNGSLDAQRLKLLVDASLALSEVRDFDDLLGLIAKTGIEMAHCEGCSIYGVEGDHLRFLASTNPVLDQQVGYRQRLVESVRNFLIPIQSSSISGFVALSGRPLNIADVYRLDESLLYKFNPSLDQRHQYRSCSMLTLPMCDTRGYVLGVMQFINHRIRETRAIAPFPEADVMYLTALANQVGVLLRNARMNHQLRESRVEAVKKFVIASEFTDKDTGAHIERMGRYSALFCELLGLGSAYAEDLRLASMLHDVGKITTPDAILKKPGPLSADELVIMRQHAQNGYDILRDAQSPLLQLGATVAISHHEKWDGSGYPNGLAGEQIPMVGRIVALADVYDALSTQRCYKEPWPLDQVIDFITGESGKQFDPRLVKLFMTHTQKFLDIQHAA